MGPNKENLQIVHKRVELSGTCTDDKLLVDITTSFYYNSCVKKREATDGMKLTGLCRVNQAKWPTRDI